VEILQNLQGGNTPESTRWKYSRIYKVEILQNLQGGNTPESTRWKYSICNSVFILYFYLFNVQKAK
jgi:hypothetical protein